MTQKILSPCCSALSRSSAGASCQGAGRALTRMGGRTCGFIGAFPWSGTAQISRQKVRVTCKFGRFAGQHDSALRKHVDTVGVLQRLLSVLFDNHDGWTGTADPCEEFHQFQRDLWCQTE